MATLPVQTLDDKIRFDVRVSPRSSREAVQGIHGDAVKISLTTPPVEGKANRALIAFLSKRLGVAKRAVRIVRGDTGRNKTVEVDGVSAATLRAALLLSEPGHESLGFA